MTYAMTKADTEKFVDFFDSTLEGTRRIILLEHGLFYVTCQLPDMDGIDKCREYELNAAKKEVKNEAD